MKFCFVVAATLLAGAVHAAAQSPEPAAPSVQALIDEMEQGFRNQCQEKELKLAAAKPDDVAAATIARDLPCSCAGKALDAGFPSAMRSSTMTHGAFVARMAGAMNVCVAVAVKEQMAAPCGAGIDPFANDSTPAVAKARCTCALAEFDRMIAADPGQEADKAAAEYVAQSARPGGATAKDAAPLIFLRHVRATCAQPTADAR